MDSLKRSIMFDISKNTMTATADFVSLYILSEHFSALKRFVLL